MDKYNREINKYIILSLVGSVIGVILIKYFVIISGEIFLYNIWTDRALSRASALIQHFQVYGPEYGARKGVRTPGGGLYYYIFLIMKINESPIFIYLFAISFHFISTYLIFLIGRMIFSALAGGIAATVYIASLAVNDVAWQMWNPFFSLPFGLIGYFFFYRALCGKSPKNFLYAVAALCLATQMHISFAALMAALIVVSLLYAKNIRPHHYLGALAVGLLVFSPWILSQLFGWFPADGLPVHFFPEYSVEESASQAIPFHQSYDSGFGVLDWIKWWLRTIIEALSFAETNHIRIDLPVVSLALAGLMFVLLNPFATDASAEISALRRHGVILLLIVIICNFFIFFIGGLTHAFGAKLEINRYFIPAAPATALLSGVAIAGLRRYANLTRFSKFAQLTAIVACTAIALKAALIIYDDLRIYRSNGHFRPNWMSGFSIPYNQRRELFQRIRKTYGESFDIKNRVASAVLLERWNIEPTPSEYFPEIRRRTRKAEKFDGCLLVFWRIEVNHPTPISPEILEKTVISMQGKGADNFAPVRQAKVITKEITESYMLVHYRLPIGGCPKSFDNPYILSKEESLIEDKLQDKNIKLVTVSLPARRTRFFAKQRIPETKYPLNFMLDLDNGKSGIVEITIHSKQLNSSSATLDGYWAPMFLGSPTVVFKQKRTGKIIRHPIMTGILGDYGYTTPWTARPLELPPGIYNLRITAEIVKAEELHTGSRVEPNSSGKPMMNILLSRSYRIQ